MVEHTPTHPHTNHVLVRLRSASTSRKH